MAIVGPQSSAVSQFSAHIGRRTLIPFISFGATDPHLSVMDYPFFFRVAPNDVLQMEAIASFIANYGWREIVLIHMNDDYGSNGASTLSDALQVRGSKLVDKVAFTPEVDKPTLARQLVKLTNKQTRIFVLHTHVDVGHMVLQEASYLNMLGSGYVWIVTDLLATSLGNPSLLAKGYDYTQGIVGIRRHINQTPQLNGFLAGWKKKYLNHSLGLYPSASTNSYGLYAYDAVWVVARALDSYLNDKQTINFIKPPLLPVSVGGESELTHLNIFEGGETMRNHILQTEFIGASGPIKFSKTGDIEGASFEYINIVNKQLNTVGYWWANSSGISLKAPPNVELSALNTDISEDHTFLSYNGMPVNATRMSITWPGWSTEAPRGWTLPKNGSPLRIGVPKKAGAYSEVVGDNTDSNNGTYHGFCIEVFEAALKYLPYAVPYRYEMIGDGTHMPIYADMVLKLARQVQMLLVLLSKVVHNIDIYIYI